MKVSEQPWRILLVDDHPLIRDGLRAALHRWLPQARITEAGDAVAALEQGGAHPPQLVLLDVHLPGLSGLELLRRFRTVWPQVRVLMVAGEADAWTVREALAAGALGFVAKTRTAQCLPEALAALIEGREFLCPDCRLALEKAGTSKSGGVEPGPSVLSEREREVLVWLARGENTKSIASALSISPKTVETHRSHVMRKLGVDSVAALTRYAIRHGIASP